MNYLFSTLTDGIHHERMLEQLPLMRLLVIPTFLGTVPAVIGLHTAVI
jgi:hypothetical protein